VHAAHTASAGWVGKYTGSQAAQGSAQRGGIVPVLQHSVEITANATKLGATIAVDGTQTMRRYVADAVPKDDALELRFQSYGPGDVHGTESLAPDELLGTLVKKPDGSVHLTFGKLPAIFHDRDEPMNAPSTPAAASAPASGPGGPHVVHFKCPNPKAQVSTVRAGCMCDSEIHGEACGAGKGFRSVIEEPGGCKFTCD
jgi:hypothetical protein